MSNYMMTKDQWNEIVDGLQRFMEDRRLTSEMQKEGYLRNITEELDEYAKAGDDIEEIIDSICDICVFSINILDKGKYCTNISFEVPGHNPKLNLLDMILRVHTLGNFINDELVIIKIVKELYCYIVALGYDPYLCMIETIKEISSRSGDWNEERKKFIKHPGAYSSDEIYEKYQKVTDPTIFVLQDEIENKYNVYKKTNTPIEECGPNDIVIGGDKSDIKYVYKYFESYVCWYRADYNKCKLPDKN